MARIYNLVPLPCGPFAGLGLVERAVFGLIYDRYRLSNYNLIGSGSEGEWYDDRLNEVYCVYAHAELAADAGISERTVRRALEVLRDDGLLYWRKATYKGACRFYLPHGITEYLKSESIRSK